MSSEARSALRQSYRDSEAVVRSVFRDDPAGARRHYERYVGFVLAHAGPSPAHILEIGCGNGWSASCLRQAGHRALGIDLHVNALEAAKTGPGLPYVAADAQSLPFRSLTFDVVAMHEVLEHVADPQGVLEECVRVLRPRGRLIVVGPHLLSAGLALRGVLAETWKTARRGGRWPARTQETPRHPFGNTPPEMYAALAHHAYHTVRKSLGEAPVRFLMREPDPRPPFHADNDACYFCNPMDLLLWSKQRGGLRPVRWWAADRRWGRLLWPVLGGTWVVLEKAAA